MLYYTILCAKIREWNLYKEGDRTPYNQPVIGCNLQRCWEGVLAQSDYHRRRQAVHDFNTENRWKKKGISVVPVKFGIAFTAVFLNQVQVYVDIIYH